jgi:very-short-patch-repair endonuclease
MSDKGYKRPTARSRELRVQVTLPEQRLWAGLSATKVAGVRFNRQFPIGPFVCDFVWRSAKLVIEVDGESHGHTERADAARTRYIGNMGYRVIRFWNNDVMERLEGVVAEIKRVLADRPSQHQVKQPPAVLDRPGDDRPDAPSREAGGE